MGWVVVMHEVIVLNIMKQDKFIIINTVIIFTLQTYSLMAVSLIRYNYTILKTLPIHLAFFAFCSGNSLLLSH